jgi:SAM-dependent methyltransferase
MKRVAFLAAVILTGGLPVGVFAGAAPPHQAPPQKAPPEQATPHDATAHHSFAEVEKWVKVFDDPERDEWQKPAEVAAALDLKPGMVVADLGAGTGYFERHLSKAVRPGGIVLAIDTEPEMVEHIGKRTRGINLDNVVPVLAAQDDPFLPRGRVDRVLIVDTYHHIDGRLEYFRAMRDALTPDGRVAIVDFHKKPLPVGPPPEHKLPRDFVVDEMKQAGWILADEKTFLPYQYFLIFAPVRP